MFQTVGQVVLDEVVSDENVRGTIFSQVKKEDLAKQIAQLSDWEKEKPNHLFRCVVDKFNYLRQFSPAVVSHLSFEGSSESHTSLLDATSLLKEMNQQGKRKLPDETPIAFISKKLRPLVVLDDAIDKHAWECALLTKVRDEIKAGNLSVKHSKRFGPFDRFFISTNQWESMREEFFRQASLPISGEEAALYLTDRLTKAYDQFLETLPQNTYAKVEKDRWHLSVDNTEPLDSTQEAKLDALKVWLEKQMRQINLPQLLIEVDNELHFTRYFLPLAQQQSRPVDEIAAIIAAIMAHGCNIGPDTMAQLTKGVTYRQIKRITDWQLIEENQRQALALVVNAIAALDMTKTWGEGKTSASDGQRFAFRSKVLQQTYSHKFSDFALEFYSFIADNYAPFYGIPIECNERDAPYVLDGVLYNESDLQLEEHYTDTHGYTEINFAAFAMLGKRFCPRIRNLSKQRIYRIDEQRDYGALQPLVARTDRTIKMDWVVDQWDRMGQFYATLQSGQTTASVALKRLNSMSRRNQFYRANRELGRIFKTEFILQYMSQPAMRRQVRRGLLKVDQLHTLARDVAYGKRGRITKRDFYELMKTCSCLTLILACIVYWQAREIERVIAECKTEADGIDTSLLEHVSPIEWDNVVLYGEYLIDHKWIR
jgi:TnpA family transposase